MKSKTTIRWGEAAALVITIITLEFVYLNFYKIPERIVTNWSINGSPLGYGDRNAVCFYWAALVVSIIFLFSLISRIGKYKPVNKKAKLCYSLSLLAVQLFYTLPFLSIILWNIGIKTNFLSVFTFSGGVSLLLAGIIFSQIEKSWFFIEIKNRWTSANVTVWKSTHIFCVAICCVGGSIAVITSVLKPAIGFIAFVLTVGLIYPLAILYSYLHYKFLNKN